MTLLEYIKLPHRWRWGGMGGDDCTTFAASWVLQATGKDPAIDLRGTYSDEAGANAVLDAAGGCEALVESRLRQHGFARTGAPADGDIGIVKALFNRGAAGDIVKEIPGIKFGPLWLVMSAHGPIGSKLEWTGAAWKIL